MFKVRGSPPVLPPVLGFSERLTERLRKKDSQIDGQIIAFVKDYFKNDDWYIELLQARISVISLKDQQKINAYYFAQFDSYLSDHQFNCFNTLIQLIFVFSGVTNGFIISKAIQSELAADYTIKIPPYEATFSVKGIEYWRITSGKGWAKLASPSYDWKSELNVDKFALSFLTPEINIYSEIEDTKRREKFYLTTVREWIKSSNLGLINRMIKDVNKDLGLSSNGIVKVYYVAIFTFRRGHAFCLLQLPNRKFLHLQSWENLYHLTDWLKSMAVRKNYDQVMKMLKGLKEAIIQDEWNSDTAPLIRSWFHFFSPGPTFRCEKISDTNDERSFKCLPDGPQFRYYVDRVNINDLPSQVKEVCAYLSKAPAPLSSS